ncbi:MAG: polyprenyl synthetase family protein, partial [Candidatus Bathyarchaeia archaeon]
PFSAGLEILHNFTLIHDDIMDNDDLRRGVSTVHKKWGIPIAICAGDLLFAKVFEAMTELAPTHVPRRHILQCIERTAKGTTLICEGQVMDIIFPESNDISEEDYLSMVGKKTSALFKTCAEVGAIIGGGKGEQVEALGEFAWNAGIAFQIIDDYLGTVADEQTLGKPIGSDLREGKRTLIVIHALKNASGDQRELVRGVLGNEEAEDKDVYQAIKILEEIDSLDYTLGKAYNYAEKAKSYLKDFKENDAKKDLIDLVDYFIQRTY